MRPRFLGFSGFGGDQDLGRGAGAVHAPAALSEEYPYLILDAHYERVHEAGVIYSRAALIAIGIDGDGRRQVLAAELADWESAGSWQEFLIKLKERGLRGVHLVLTDRHQGLKQAIAKVLPTAL